MDEDKQKLVDRVLEQMLNDIEDKDLTAIEELISGLPTDKLEGYLPEES
tara:strand:- start:579 stop:725 length:147 start_codon:yes stop_codon:yes gene_type:complete